MPRTTHPPVSPQDFDRFFHRGLRANHQMEAMVASTPAAAAGLAIFRERSDMGVTIPPGALVVRRRNA